VLRLANGRKYVPVGLGVRRPGSPRRSPQHAPPRFPHPSGGGSKNESRTARPFIPLPHPPRRGGMSRFAQYVIPLAGRCVFAARSFFTLH